MISTARPGEDEAYLRDLGTQHTMDDTGDVPATVAALRPPGIHVVVNPAGDGLELADLLVPGRRIASTAALPSDQLGGRAVQAMPVRAVPDGRTLERLAADVVHGQLTVPVRRTYPLANVPPCPGRLRRRHPWEAGHQRGMTPAALGGLGLSPEPGRTRPRPQGRDGPGHCWSTSLASASLLQHTHSAGATRCRK